MALGWMLGWMRDGGSALPWKLRQKHHGNLRPRGRRPVWASWDMATSDDTMICLPLGWIRDGSSDFPWEVLPASWLGQNQTSSRLRQKHHGKLRPQGQRLQRQRPLWASWEMATSHTMICQWKMGWMPLGWIRDGGSDLHWEVLPANGLGHDWTSRLRQKG